MRESDAVNSRMIYFGSLALLSSKRSRISEKEMVEEIKTEEE